MNNHNNGCLDLRTTCPVSVVVLTSFWFSFDLFLQATVRQWSLLRNFKKLHAVELLLFLHHCLMLDSGAGSRTLCHIDTVNSDSLGAWLWEHAKSKQLSIALAFCEQGTDQGKMRSISVYFQKNKKRAQTEIILRVYDERLFVKLTILHKTEDWSSWSYILEFVLKLLILGNIMKLLSSIRALSRVFWKDGDKETFFFT